MGEISALGCALLWALTTIALRSQSERVPILAMNAIRAGYAAVFFVILLAFAGRLAETTTIPVAALGALAASVLVGMALGDSLHIRSMQLIGVSRALPISSAYPIVTSVLAVLFLGEPLSLWAIVGILLVVAGVYLVAFPRHGGRVAGEESGSRVPGVALAAAAAVCWAVSTVVVRPALDVIDPVLANAIRLPITCVVLATFSLRTSGFASPFAYGWRSTAVLATTGLLTGLSSILWLYSVHEAGAARAATLSSTSPIFAAPLSVVLLRERLTTQIALGTLLTVVGIWLVL